MQGKTIYRSDANVTIGTDVDWTDWFDGEIDEVSLLNKTLSQDEIVESMYNGILSQHENNLRGYWKFNSGSGSVIFDHSGNGNHGTINNATWSNEVPTSGCIDPLANNYNSEASFDDGSCTYQDNGNYYLSFDGVDDYVDISNSHSLNFGESSISYSLWFKKPESTHYLQSNLITNYKTSSLPCFGLYINGTYESEGPGKLGSSFEIMKMLKVNSI